MSVYSTALQKPHASATSPITWSRTQAIPRSQRGHHMVLALGPYDEAALDELDRHLKLL